MKVVCHNLTFSINIKMDRFLFFSWVCLATASQGWKVSLCENIFCDPNMGGDCNEGCKFVDKRLIMRGEC